MKIILYIYIYIGTLCYKYSTVGTRYTNGLSATCRLQLGQLSNADGVRADGDTKLLA